MARKKKLNKRVVVFLVVGVVVIMVGGITLIIPRLPQDADALAERARQATAAKDYGAAEGAWSKAIAASNLPEHYCEAAKLQVEIANLPETPEAERIQRVRRALSMLQTALRRDPNHVEALRMLLDAYGPDAGEAFLREADRLLALVPDDHEIYFRRALAKANLAEALPGA